MNKFPVGLTELSLYAYNSFQGLLRHVPVLGSVFSWLSPPAKESHGITGRAFNLASGETSSFHPFPRKGLDFDQCSYSVGKDFNETFHKLNFDLSIAPGDPEKPSRARSLSSFLKSNAIVKSS